MNLSFAGCGFLGIYHIGVVTCLREYAPKIANKLSGASAGALAATLLICECPLGQITSDVLRMTGIARGYTLGPFSPSFDVVKILKDHLAALLPPDAYTRCTNRLFISVTRVSDGKNCILSEFSSNEELIQALLCSSFIPIFSGYIPPTYRGVRYIDGCYSDNLPAIHENTVTISPFCGESDICPRDNSYNLLQVNLANTSIEVSPQNLYRFMRVLFPPHPEIMSQMCKQGFDDTLRFLQRNDLISCTRCLAVNSIVQLEESNFSTNESDLDINSKKDKIRKITMNNKNETCIDMEYGECKDCRERQQVAVLDDLPEAVLTVLEEACSSMNKGFLNWILKNKTMRILSVLTLPYVLPLNVAYVICIRLMELVPKLTRDVQIVVENFISYFKNVFNKLSSHGHWYKAKITCHFTITEYDDLESGILPKLLKPSVEVEEPAIKCISNSSRLMGTMNFDFSLGFPETPNPFQLLQRSPSPSRHPIQKALDASPTECAVVDLANATLHGGREMYPKHHHGQQKPYHHRHYNLPGISSVVSDCAVASDTYEHMLEVTQNQEAIVAFYYMEGEKMRVTEIFDVTEAGSSPTEQLDTSSSCNNMSSSWPGHDARKYYERFQPVMMSSTPGYRNNANMSQSDSALDLDYSFEGLYDDKIFQVPDFEDCGGSNANDKMELNMNVSDYGTLPCV